jgi:hypothetical protein
VHANLDKTYNTILRATYALAFFGTPHQGGNLVKFGDIAATIARKLFRNPSNTFLAALRAESLFADDLVQDFRQQLENYRLLSFYETKPTGGLGVVSEAWLEVTSKAYVCRSSTKSRPLLAFLEDAKTKLPSMLITRMSASFHVSMAMTMSKWQTTSSI